MLTFYRKEIKLLFFSLSTYLFLFLTLLSFGILSSVFNLYFGYASLSYPLGYMTLILAILLPFFVFFSTRAKGNDEELLLSLPVSRVSVFLGEFFATVTVLLIPFLVFSLIPFLFSLFGTSAIPTSEVALLGCFLYSLFLLSAVKFFFCVIERRLFALIGSLLFTLAVYFFNSLFFLLPFPESGPIQKLSSLLNPTGMYYCFTYGKFNLPGTVYFLTVSILFLSLSLLFLLKKRGYFFHYKKRLLSILLCIFLSVTVFVSNIAVSLLPERISYTDVTGVDISRLSGTTLDTLHALNEPLTLYVLSEGGYARADKELLSFFRRYEEESEYLRLEIIDTTKNPDFSLSYTSKKLNDQSVIIKGEKRYYTIDSADLYYYYNEQFGAIPSDYYNYYISSYIKYIQTSSAQNMNAVNIGKELYYSNSTVAYFNGDNLLLNAILFITSHNARSVYVASTDAFSLSKNDTTFEETLSKNQFFVSYLDTIEKIPSDCDLLVLPSPIKDITQKEKEGLESYLAKGGNIFLTTDCASPELPLLSSLLSDYGLSGSYGIIVCETDKNHIISEETTYYFSATINASLYATDFEGLYVSLLSHPIQVEEKEGVKVNAILSTTEKGALMDPESRELIENGEIYTLGAVSKKENSSILWLSSSLAVSSTSNTLSSGGNIMYVLSILEDLCPSQSTSVSISPILMTSPAMTLSEGDLALWTLVIAVLIPLIPLSIGIIYTYTRRKR